MTGASELPRRFTQLCRHATDACHDRCAPALVEEPLFPGPRCRCAWRAGRLGVAHVRRVAETARRWLHQAGEDDHHAGDLPHRHNGHREHARSRRIWADCRQGAGLLHHCINAGACHWPARRDRRSARGGAQRRPGHARYEQGRHLRDAGEGNDGHRVRAEHHPRYDVQRTSSQARSCRCCWSPSYRGSRWP